MKKPKYEIGERAFTRFDSSMLDGIDRGIVCSAVILGMYIEHGIWRYDVKIPQPLAKISGERKVIPEDELFTLSNTNSSSDNPL